MPHPARPTVTLHDVAAAAGVSLSTASRVLGGSSRTVAPEYAEKVLAAAAALRYTADASARAMRRASDSIALVADDLTTASIGLVLAAMEREARTVDAFVTVTSTGGTPPRQLETVRLMCALRPRALVLTSSRLDADLMEGRLLRELLDYRRDGGRVVIFGDTDMPFDAISIDNRASAALVGAYLARAGHRRVTILAGAAERANVSARAAGFVDGLSAGGVHGDDIRVVHCDVSRQGGFAAVTRLLAAGPLDTEALVCANDVIAIGAMSALRAAGVRVPDEVSVTGFDDIPLATDVTPRLTTVTVPLARIGRDAIRLALGDHDEPHRTTEHGELVPRDSTRPRA
ncbi:LacI family DNA-binding transcriptional regulator [Phytohabitans sp. ZYX-F-186]|uniref:LacI family DNA-binding transcriptional regulator n=1 Tax=Phytohabitans maris TaxID=3071409 RepID=A0ABU0ZSF7_9ACTN|nr:LacI family DNA-binding transcriptional regulator [Phytohabitans sp. ZYX-F-186]MDQ7909893.1 LacI family DNA-binding transcriptional regulator [Phytohabitans sp. ZYX-F-186]